MSYSDLPRSARRVNFTIKGTLSSATGTYEGDLVEYLLDPQIKIRHGQGVMKYLNGNFYMGEWKNDFFDGFGEYAWSDGRTFKGCFKQDKMHGKGVVHWPDGRKFEGEYKMDMVHGHGIVNLADGRAFEGEFSYDFPVAGQMMEMNGDTFQASFDGKTYVSEWKPHHKVLVGRFENGWRSTDTFHALREFAWHDGRRFAGSFNGYCPSIGVITDLHGKQYCVAYGGNTLFSEEPIPTTKIRLKTQASLLSLPVCVDWTPI
jgi:hypothetical protein